MGKGPDPHGYNDLCINSRGDVFITDGLFSAVYWISYEKDELDLFLKQDHFTNLNGIAISKDEKYLYVSHIEGTSMINVNTKSFHILSHFENMALTHIDSLYFYEKSLMAIQRDNWHDRVIQFFLNEDLNQVESYKIIEFGNLLFMLPTTGVIVDNNFNYIAKSQMNFPLKTGQFIQWINFSISLYIKYSCSFVVIHLRYPYSFNDATLSSPCFHTGYPR